MACGPKRAPLRLVVPISSGMPAIEIAAPSRRPIPRKPGGTAKVGTSLAIVLSLHPPRCGTVSTYDPPLRSASASAGATARRAPARRGGDQVHDTAAPRSVASPPVETSSGPETDASFLGDDHCRGPGHHA